jgi:hypothetical protein
MSTRPLPYILSLIILSIATLSCRRTGPSADDPILTKFVFLHFVDSNNDNLISKDTGKFNMFLARLNMRESRSDTTWYEIDWQESPTGPIAYHGYYHRMGYTAEQFRHINVDHTVLFRFGDDIDTFRILKADEHYLRMYWNGHLNATFAAMDTAIPVVRVPL